MNRRYGKAGLLMLVLTLGGISVAIVTDRPEKQNAGQSAAINQIRALSISHLVCDFLSKQDDARSIDELASHLSEVFSSKTPQPLPEKKIDRCDKKLNDKESSLLSTMFITLSLDEAYLEILKYFNLEAKSVSELVKALGNSVASSFDIYYTDEKKQLLGFSVEKDDKRIYVVVNFSYDMHDLPLPLGFMASTKIKLWKSDSGEVDEFVTQGPLSIDLLSTAVIIVD